MKYRLYGDEKGGLVLLTAVNFDTIDNNPYSGDPATPIYNIELIGDTQLYNFGVGINLGYRARTPGDQVQNIPVEPLGSQLTYSLAISRFVNALEMQFIAEIYGSEPADESVSREAQRTMRSSEGLLGLKYLVNQNLAAHFGAATYLQQTATSPDLRIYAGLNYVFGPVFQPSKNKKLRRRTKTLAPIPPPPGIANLDTNPQPSVPLPSSEPEVYVLENIEFSFDSFRKILPGSLSEIDRMAEILQQRSFSRLVIAGHTDALGSDAYNNKLSQQRAETIRAYLLKKYQFSAAKVVAKGFGESIPIADNATLQGRQRNRRVEFKVFN